MVAAVQPRAVFAVRLANGEGSFSCRPDETVLAAMERVIGVRRIPVGCRRGGCGVCRVQVLAGAYRLQPQSRNHVSREEEGEGYALACRLIPDSDLELRPALKLRLSANQPAAQFLIVQPNDKESGGTPNGH